MSHEFVRCMFIYQQHEQDEAVAVAKAQKGKQETHDGCLLARKVLKRVCLTRALSPSPPLSLCVRTYECEKKWRAAKQIVSGGENALHSFYIKWRWLIDMLQSSQRLAASQFSTSSFLHSLGPSFSFFEVESSTFSSHAIFSMNATLHANDELNMLTIFH